MSKVNTIEVHVPFVPTCVDHALVTAKPLAESLATAAPEFRNVRRVKFSKLQPIERAILKQCESNAATARARINVHLSKIDELFSAVQTSIKLSGKHLELITIANWYPKNAALSTRVAQLHEISGQAQAKVKTLALELSLDNVRYLPDTPVNPALIFDACVIRLKELQKEWQTAYFDAIDQGLKLQNLYLLGSAAGCLGQICKFSLSQTMEFDPQPEAQEAVFMAIKDSLRNPCSGAWPKTMTVAKKAVVANGEQMGEIA
ncbi:MAG: hypothetical protein Q7K57_25905 [Burkholderiaceae bacterium]|nr:hypothetical protein [Burkholderiaceae bacterium]